MIALVDNDVLLKGSCLGILRPLIGRHPVETGVLGASRYVLPSRIRRFRTGDKGSAALRELLRYLRSATEFGADRAGGEVGGRPGVSGADDGA